MTYKTNGIEVKGMTPAGGGPSMPVWLPLLFLVGLVVPPLLLLLVPAGIIDVHPQCARSAAGVSRRAPLVGAFFAAPPRSPPV